MKQRTQLVHGIQDALVPFNPPPVTGPRGSVHAKVRVLPPHFLNRLGRGKPFLYPLIRGRFNKVLDVVTRCPEIARARRSISDVCDSWVG